MLSLKYVAINSFNENTVYLHKDCDVYKVDDIKNITKIEIHGGAEPVSAFLEVVEDETIVQPDELGVNKQAFEQLNLPEGANVTISLANTPSSVASIKRKISGNVLYDSEYKAIIKDITSKKYSNMDIASFLVSTGSFMTVQEVLALTEALAGDETIHWDNENIVVDHHCLGGVPGNKTDIIITAIVAAYGLPIPKTASHSLTSCAGTADTFSVLANVDLDEKSLKKIVREHRGAIANYSKLPITYANKIISSVQRSLGIVKQEHILASVIAIKLATGVSHLLIDIPVGPTASIKTTNDALKIRKMIEYVGDMLNLQIDAVITDGSEPIGNGVGAVLEARDVMKVLRNKENAPQDLMEKSLFLAGRIIEFDPKVRGGQGYHIAKEILKSGRALETLNHIIYAQGKAPQAQLGRLTRDITAEKSGVVASINNTRITRIGVLAGAQQNAGAGVDLLKKVGDTVERGDVIYRVHSVNPNDFAFANSAVDGDNGYEITSKRK